jgi:hypothetical protein
MVNLPISPFDNPLVKTLEGVQDAKMWRVFGFIAAALLAAVVVYNLFFKEEKPKDKPLSA